MRSLLRDLPAWIEYARVHIRQAYMYRFNVVVAFLLTGITIYLLTVVWRSAYGEQRVVDGIALEQMLVYLTIANLQVRFLSQEVDEEIRDRIREGQIAFDLNRPAAYPGQLMAGAVGDMIGALPFLVVAIPVAMITGELRPPDSAGTALAYIASLLLAWIVAVQLNLVIGLTAFWTLEMTGFQMIYRLVANFATGALIPLWFMPDAVEAIVQVLPFQAIAFVPVSIYVGAPATGGILNALGVQVLWIGLLTLGIRWIWTRAIQHTVIQGG
ncbi:MAG: ABC-2 family transporter protein [Chloroflexota bacterium]|nr:ABC-2 family transporter protein [Chloroflexota bacterium]